MKRVPEASRIFNSQSEREKKRLALVAAVKCRQKIFARVKPFSDFTRPKH
jgi:hypothetical protein